MMRKTGFRAFSATIFGILCATFIAVSATPSYALTAGCDPAVWEAMKSRADAKVAYDVAVTEETIKKPDSVVAMTCFDQSTKVSAQNSGSIFSGDFSQEMSNVVGDSLDDFVGDNFAGSILDLDGLLATFGDVFGTMVTSAIGSFLPSWLGGAVAALFSPNCDTMGSLWDNIMDDPIDGGTPFASFEELVGGVAGGTNFDANLAAMNPLITAADTQLDALPNPNIPNFAGANSLDDVLTAAGI